MNKENLIINIFFTIVLILGWAGILFVSFLLYLLSDMFRNLGNGILVYITVFIYVLAFVLPIIFRKRISKYLCLPVSFIIFTIFSVIIVSSVLVGARSYISSFSQEKWNNNEELRFYMIDDLEQKHHIVGKTKNEIIKLIGKPTYTYDNKEIIYEYFIGFNMIDEICYQIEFENNIAIKTTLVEH